MNIIFVHNSNDRIRKQEEILMKTLDLEERFPTLSFDYLILYTEEAVLE